MSDTKMPTTNSKNQKELGKHEKHRWKLVKDTQQRSRLRQSHPSDSSDSRSSSSSSSEGAKELSFGCNHSHCDTLIRQSAFPTRALSQTPTRGIPQEKQSVEIMVQEEAWNAVLSSDGEAREILRTTVDSQCGSRVELYKST